MIFDDSFMIKLNQTLYSTNLSEHEKANVIKLIKEQLDEYNLRNTKENLQLMYDYEKHYLELIKNYKEEIRFANNLKEDLRREKTMFFSKHLKEVIETIECAKVEEEVGKKWIDDLIKSYLTSIDLSEAIIDTKVMQKVNDLRQASDRLLMEIAGSEK